MGERNYTIRRADGNQPKLVSFIRACGASWQHTHTVGGALDGIIGYAGVDQRVEIKDPDQPASKRKLTPAEQETFDTWKGRRPVVIETEDDILAVLSDMAKRS